MKKITPPPPPSPHSPPPRSRHRSPLPTTPTHRSRLRSPSCLSTRTPIGVTVISPSYREVGKEAVKRFKHLTGLDVHIIRCRDEDGFRTKLRLDKECGRRPIIFFDADYWLLDRPGFEAMTSPALIAAHDPATYNPYAFPHTDCEAFGLPKMEYFNSGLLILDFRLPQHRQLFQLARALHKRGKEKPTDTTDQFWLNLARHRLRIPLSRLPTHYNFYLLSAYWGQQAWIPRHIIGLHGAGIPAREKLPRLQQQSTVFTHEYRPMHPEAMAFEVARMIELR